MLRLVKLTIEGLKSRDQIITIGAPVIGLAGVNGAGKTAAIQALHLLALGSAPGLPKTPDGIMRLARDRRISIRAAFGEAGAVERIWTRGSDDKVTERIQGSLLPRGCSTKQAAALLSAKLGGWIEAWRPEDLLSLSAAKLRHRLVQLLGGDDLGIERWLPSACPTWAKPHDGQLVDEWIVDALAAARSRLSNAQAEARRLEALLESTAFGKPRDSVPVHARLARLRDELGAAREAGRVAAATAALAARLAGIRAATPTDAPSLAWAEQQLEEAVRVEAEVRAAEYGRRSTLLAIGRLEADLEVLARKLARAPRETAGLTALEAAEDALDAAVAEREEAEAALGQAAAGVSQALANLRALSADSPLSTCPHCGGDLLEWLEGRRRDAGNALSDVQTVHREAARRATGGRQREASARSERDRLRAASDAREDLAEGWRLSEEVARLRAQLGGAVDLAAAERAVREARGLVEAARASRQADEEVVRLEAELERTAQPDDEVRPIAAIEADIASAEAELIALGKHNEEVSLREDTQEQIKLQADEVQAAREWVSVFEGIEQRILDTVRARIEAPVSALLGGARVTVELRDARGNDTCRFAVDGVDVASISTGEQLTFVAGLLVALAKGAQTDWPVIVIDRFESVSADNRAGFLQALVAAVRDGAIAQAFVAGCPDNWPDVDGVHVVHVGADAVEEAA